MVPVLYNQLSNKRLNLIDIPCYLF